MSLINCPDCGKECSTIAATCPNCGRPLGRQRAQEGFLHKFGRIIFGVFALMIVLSLGFCCLGNRKNVSQKTGDESSKSVSNSELTSVPNSANILQKVSSAELLADAKKSLRFQEQFTDRDYYSIYSLLTQIPSDAVEYQESQQILNQYKKQIDLAKQKFQLENQQSNSQPNLSNTKIDESSPAWKEGYKVGLKDGRDPDNPSEYSIVNFNVSVRGAVIINKPKDPKNWENGYRKGFIEGYDGYIQGVRKK